MKTGPDHRVNPASNCLNCGHKLDAATAVDNDDADERTLVPRPGALTICIACGHLMAFDLDMTMRELTSAEMHEMAGDPRILAIQRARAALARKREQK